MQIIKITNQRQLLRTDNCRYFPRKSNIFLLLASFLIFFSCLSSLSAEPVKPGNRDQCPVCGMFVAPYPNWVAQIEFNDGSREFFDGAKDMFRYYLKLQDKGPVHSKENIAAIYVTEYYSTKVLPVEQVFFVTGSDILGPMGNELVPVHSKESAETFKQEHKGKVLFTFEQVTSDILSGL